MTIYSILQKGEEIYTTTMLDDVIDKVKMEKAQSHIRSRDDNGTAYTLAAAEFMLTNGIGAIEYWDHRGKFTDKQEFEKQVFEGMKAGFNSHVSIVGDGNTQLRMTYKKYATITDLLNRV
ncbi:hypothetical protein H6503_04085 [Candidatus Woesearchaeota archaeon]|nr:hypothetical protein [Candidatus Woesearchaeota archaeon]